MKKRTLIKNAVIVSPKFEDNKKYDIYIEDGIIKEIGNNLDVDAKVIDAEGRFVLPGFIDMYCKICDTGYENKNNIVMISRSAARGGFTSITSLPNSQPVIDNKTVVEYVYSKTSEKAEVNIYPYGSMTKGCLGREVSEIGEMVLAGVVALSDGGNPIDDSRLLRNILLYSKMFNVPVITFCMDKQLMGNGVINSGYMSTRMGLEGIPKEAEDVVVARNILLAQSTGANLHISHITTKNSVDIVRYAKSKGVKITVGTAPHYFALSEMAIDGYNTFAKVMPPLRTKEDIEAVKEGLKDGTIDVITSGHTPVTIDKKMMEFDNAAFGISSLETAFPVSYCELVETGILTLRELVEKMVVNPAKILGLKNKGLIDVGYDGDLIVIDVDKEYTIKGSDFISKAKYSPFEGKKVKGFTIATIVGGNPVNYEKNC